MKTLILDGEWNLKRNFEVRTNLFSFSGEYCGGVYGFLETLGDVINKVLPDRVIVVWDGDMSGKLRHDIYPLYKADHKSWDSETYYRTEEQLNAETRKKISCTNQKIKVKNYLEGLFIRQIEVDYIEGDDLIAQYVLTKDDTEVIIIYSRDQDYYQLVNDNVYVLRPVDKILVTPKNFKKLFGYPLKNALLLKCFKGDESDKIKGVPGIGFKTILKYFPKFTEEEYTFERILDETYELYNKKKLKTFESILGSKPIIDRNKILMDLHNPFVNEEAISEIENLRISVLAKENGFVDRSVMDVMKEVRHEGYNKWMLNSDPNLFFAPFHRIAIKEKEFTKMMLNG